MMKYTLITGASSGIGYELTKVFAEHNHNLILVARSADKLNELKVQLEARHPIQVQVLPADLSLPGASLQLFQSVQNQGFTVDNLINNAGIGDYGPFHEADFHRQMKMVQVNIVALTELTKLFLPQLLLQNPGRIMNVASTAAFQPGPLMSVYYATKAYVLFFSEGLAEELKNTPVRITVLCPGPTLSGFQAAANIKNIPLMTAVTPPSSEKVARYGYEALMAHQLIAVQGFLNQILSSLVGIVPRSWVRKLVMKMQENKR